MPFFANWMADRMGELGGLIAHNTLLGQIVLSVLLFMSVFSWALMVERGRRLRRAERANARFWERFRDLRGEGHGVERLADWSEERKDSPLAVVFAQFGRELWPLYRAQREQGGGGRALTEMLTRGIDRVSSDQMNQLERGVSWLATFTSTAPFIGLLGTVYGILTSFLEIGRQGSASLDAVGPGIAEALIATVAGLAVAIPAAVAYNYFVGKLRHQDAELQALGSQLFDLLARDEMGSLAPPSEAPRERALS